MGSWILKIKFGENYGVHLPILSDPFFFWVAHVDDVGTVDDIGTVGDIGTVVTLGQLVTVYFGDGIVGDIGTGL